MVGATSSIEGVLADFLTPILPNIDVKPTIEGLVNTHQLIRGDVELVSSNLGGGQHGHLALTMTSKDYSAWTGFVFVPPQNLVYYPPNTENAQDQALGTEKF